MFDDYEKHEIALLVAFFIFLGLDILDVISTVVGIMDLHLVEINPVAIYFIGMFGLLPALIVLKAFFLTLIGVTIYVVLKDIPGFLDDDVLIATLTIVDFVGLLVLSNNFGLLGWPFFFAFRFQP